MRRVLVRAAALAAILCLLFPALASAGVLPTAVNGGSSVSAPALSPALVPGTLYDNGPINGAIDAWTINFGFQVSNSFTLSQTSNVTGAQVGLWLFPGDVPTSLDWTISTAQTGNPVNTNVPPASIIASGTASGSSLTNTFQFTNIYGYSIFESAFPLNLTLAPGTYWLSLGPNATASNGDPLYWDQNNGPSMAYENTVGNLADYTGPPPGGSESFQIFGNLAVPEPASVTLFGMAFLGAAGYFRRRLRKPARA